MLIKKPTSQQPDKPLTRDQFFSALKKVSRRTKDGPSVQVLDKSEKAK
jgi:hypothetical protein